MLDLCTVERLSRNKVRKWKEVSGLKWKKKRCEEGGVMLLTTWLPTCKFNSFQSFYCFIYTNLLKCLSFNSMHFMFYGNFENESRRLCRVRDVHKARERATQSFTTSYLHVLSSTPVTSTVINVSPGQYQRMRVALQF